MCASSVCTAVIDVAAVVIGVVARVFTEIGTAIAPPPAVICAVVAVAATTVAVVVMMMTVMAAVAAACNVNTNVKDPI